MNNKSKRVIWGIIFLIETIILIPLSLMAIIMLAFAFDAPGSESSVINLLAVIMMITEFICFWISWSKSNRLFDKQKDIFRKDVLIYLIFLPGFLFPPLGLILMVYNIKWCNLQLYGSKKIDTSVKQEEKSVKKAISNKTKRNFFDAILEQDETTIQELLKEFPELAKMPSSVNGNTALHVCALNNYTRIADLILSFDDTARVCLNDIGESPYEIALAHGYEQLANKLK